MIFFVVSHRPTGFKERNRVAECAQPAHHQPKGPSRGISKGCSADYYIVFVSPRSHYFAQRNFRVCRKTRRALAKASRRAHDLERFYNSSSHSSWACANEWLLKAERGAGPDYSLQLHDPDKLVDSFSDPPNGARQSLVTSHASRKLG